MKRILIALVCWLATQAWAATYVIVAPKYLYPYDYGSCDAGHCANFTTAMSVEGRIDLSEALGPNVQADLKAKITGFTISDGLTTYSSSDPQVQLQTRRPVPPPFPCGFAGGSGP